MMRRTVKLWLAVVVGIAAAASMLLAPGSADASSVTVVSFTGSVQTAGASNTTWTVGFTTSGGSGQAGALKKGDAITIVFDSHFTVPTLPGVSLISGFSGCSASASASSTTVIVTLGTNGCSLAKGTPGSLQLSGITNPTSAQTYPAANFSVSTSADTSAFSPNAGVAISPAAASKLAFTSAPSGTTSAGQTFAAQPAIAVEDQYSNVVTTSTASIALAVTGGATLTCDQTQNTRNASGGIASFTGCKMNTAGTFTLQASSPPLTSATSNSFTITAAAASKLAFVQTPTDAFAGTAMSPAVTVQVTDAFGNAVPTSTTVTLSPSAGSFSGNSVATNASGLATFSNLVSSNTALGVTLTASAGSLTAVTSGTINVTVQVTSSSAALTDAAAGVSDTGSGVQKVTYYYCAGYSGACTSANWIQIGNSTTATGDYPVTWTTPPADGAYRVVAVATDNVNNTTAPSASIPVTVANN